MGSSIKEIYEIRNDDFIWKSKIDSNLIFELSMSNFEFESIPSLF